MNREGWNLPMHPMRMAIPRTAVPHFLITAMAQTCSKGRGGERDVRCHCVASERTKVKGNDVRGAERRCGLCGRLLFHAQSASFTSVTSFKISVVAR